MTRVARKSDEFSELERLLPDSQKSIDELKRVIGSAKVLKITCPFDRLGDDEPKVALIRAEISVSGDPKTVQVLLRADNE